MNITTYVKKHWNELPKSTFDEKEVIVVREINNREEGYGHHSYSGIGVDSEGKVWDVSSGGCSCYAAVDSSPSTEMLTERWQDINFELLQVDFRSYE